MRRLILLCALLNAVLCAAQPAGYYLTAEGLNGQSLRLALRNIIRPHTELSYTPGLWNAYYTTDTKPSGKIWDMYSDIPGGTPAYEYSPGADQCGSVSPSAENNCYNREHTWPQSKFGSTAPMQTDLFIVYPTDYYVNYSRGDLPYGRVGTATKTFTNSGKIGNNTYSGAPGGNCYEPIDSFKGDIARIYFYVSTCYRNDSLTFFSWEMANRIALLPWAAQMLLEWHHNDPVSQKERDRNNAAYALQNNRNPFIDRPEYADCIWGTGDCTHVGVATTQERPITYSLFPNPADNEVTITFSSMRGNGSLRLYSITGEVVYSRAIEQGTEQLSVPVSELIAGMYFAQLVTGGGVEIQRLMVR